MTSWKRIGAVGALTVTVLLPAAPALAAGNVFVHYFDGAKAHCAVPGSAPFKALSQKPGAFFPNFGPLTGDVCWFK